MEEWTEMVRSANSRWNQALELGRRAPGDARGPVSFDEWMGYAVGSWVAAVDGFNAMAEIWMATPPSRREIPTIGMVVDAQSGTATGGIDVSYPANIPVRVTNLAGLAGVIRAQDVAVTSVPGGVQVTIGDVKDIAEGQYVGMLYQDNPGGKAAIATVHFIRLAPPP